MEREAISLAKNGVLGNPFSLPTGPSAHVSPAYALLMAAIFYVFGTSTVGQAVKVLVTCLISSTQYALLPWLGKTLKLPPGIGLAAGVLGALIPLNPYIEIHGDFENHLTALLLLLLLAWTELATQRRWSAGEACIFGAFCGICVLSSSALLPLCFIILAYIGFRQSKLPQGLPATALLAFMVAVLCVVPWAARNYRQLGSVIVTRSNFGLEFYLANNELASPLMTENGRLYLCCHPLQNAGEAKKVQEQGEVAYNRRLLEESLQWIRAHPARFAGLTIQRFWFTWMPRAPQRLREVMLRLLTPLSFFGFLVVFRIRPKTALLLAMPMIVYPIPMYLVQVHFRYRYPTGFIVLITACAFGAEMLARLQGKKLYMTEIASARPG